MGYRLHASIPNVVYVDNNLELGKQYSSRWDDFNDTYFGTDSDEGMIHPAMFDEFLKDLKLIRNEIIKNKEDYPLYHIDKLEKMFEFAKENNYYIYFESY